MPQDSKPSAKGKVGGPLRPRTPPNSPKGMPTTVSVVTEGARWSVPPAAANGAYLFVRSSNGVFITKAARQNVGSINPWPQPTPSTAEIGPSNVAIGSLIDPAALPNPTPEGMVWTYLALPAGATITLPNDPSGQIPGDALFWFSAA
ncbi:hypothetical protein [Ideonella paludis]|uniref:Uncharacterized protein n=1 Tax=Ideonella paludis TaxID=1233411 RepID=A0ABS5DT78_9BURK|nr:hypothetical protein [Ideonella paludis]MBQ0934347.1 hypothetical protein [Ideonella paludis]